MKDSDASSPFALEAERTTAAGNAECTEGLTTIELWWLLLSIDLMLLEMEAANEGGETKAEADPMANHTAMIDARDLIVSKERQLMPIMKIKMCPAEKPEQ